MGLHLTEIDKTKLNIPKIPLISITVDMLHYAINKQETPQGDKYQFPC